MLAFASLGGTAEAPENGPAQDALPPSAEAVLRAAFDNYYGCDTRARVALSIRRGAGLERFRRLEIAAKRVDGLRRGMARVVAPPYLDGMTFLTLERSDRDHDAFIYLPSQQRVRRISSAQRGDAFLGSDLTHEDIQRRRVEDYELELLPPERVGAERAHVVFARPREPAAYDRLHVLVARRDSALLGVRYFKRGAESPYRVVRMPRRFMHREDGHVLPTRIEVESLERGSRTEVTFHDLKINPELDPRLFEPSWLERARPLP